MLMCSVLRMSPSGLVVETVNMLTGLRTMHGRGFHLSPYGATKFIEFLIDLCWNTDDLFVFAPFFI